MVRIDFIFMSPPAAGESRGEAISPARQHCAISEVENYVRAFLPLLRLMAQDLGDACLRLKCAPRRGRTLLLVCACDDRSEGDSQADLAFTSRQNLYDRV